MLQYILECIAFQLVFLIIYDLFLKRETFFQWNRLYLIGTYIISMVLPWIKIEAMKSAVPEAFQAYPEFFWNSNDTAVTAMVVEETTFNVSWEYVLLFGGMFLATLFFAYKLYQIYTLKRKGEVRYFHDFTRVIVSNSSLAFSFFKSIFLGDKVIAKEHQSIVQHELVHIRQRHSYDLVFFELMRIVGWFNPLVYVYQSRVSELHEFIADAQVAKTHKKEQYQLLLSEVFQTQHISFINQFFKSSLIKKRIVMLQKTNSKKIWKLKYLLLVPLVFGMLAYTSSSTPSFPTENSIQISYSDDTALIKKVKARIKKEINQLKNHGNQLELLKKVNSNHPNRSHIADSEGPILSKEDYFESAMLFRMTMQEISKTMAKERNVQMKDYSSRIPLPSTARYKSYVSRKKAFQILDENLKFSIMSNEKNKGYDVRQIDNDDNYSDESYELEVNDVRDLTGKEIGMFNNKIDEIFKNENSVYSSLVLKDKRYRFQVFATKPMIAINTWARVSSSNEKGQDDVKNQETMTDIPFAKVDEVPVFPGCENDDDKRGCFYENMREHIRKNFNYPQEAKKQELQGRVAVMFTMNTEGGLSNVKVRGPHKLLEDEAVRIISRLPKFKSGVHEGKEVNVAFSIPITFKLPGNTNVVEQKDYENSSDVPFAVVEEVPVFPGCEEEDNRRECFNKMMQKHISKNFRYPQEAQEKGIQGRVSIMFTISQDGSIQKVRMRGPDELLEKECARIVSLLPRMTPGKQKGKAVDVPFSIPITFKLQGERIINNTSSFFSGILYNKDALYIVDGEEFSQEQVQAMNLDDIGAMREFSDEAAIEKYGEKGKNGVIELITKKAQDSGSVKYIPDNGTNPIFFIDGQKSSKEIVTATNPNDIATINVIKGGAAILKYGAKGKNGVVEVLTKEFFNSNPKLEKVHSQMKLLRKERSRLLENSTEDNQIIRDLDAQIDALQKEEDKLVKEQLK